MALEYDPVANLQHWPASLQRFGNNPYGQPLYRIIFAPSRRNLAGDFSGFHWIPTYRRLGAVWVLERWRSAWDFAQMPRERWDREMLILGPYPERGEYDHCHTFFPVLPADANLDKLISWIEEGKKRSWQDNLDACKAEYEQETKDQRNMQEAILHGAYPAFGANAMVGGAVSRGTKTRPIIKTAEEIGLPHGKWTNPEKSKFMSLQREENNGSTAH